jgi:cytochrome c biogenesis protein CcmG/thiol:disulfide interchange protein DsbE
MAARRSEKERRRQLLIDKQAREERAGRRERRIYIGLGSGLLVLAAVTVAIVSSGSSNTPALPPAAPSSQAVALAASAPTGSAARATLTANVREANQILDNTTIQAKVAQLPGVPVVINQWASWCTNCRFEFPFFQQAGRADAGRVAFVGLDSQDSQSNAQAFLAKFPVDYPSVFDPSASQAQSLGGGQGWPTTIFMNAKHQITNVHVGAYPSLQALQQDVARYT